MTMQSPDPLNVAAVTETLVGGALIAAPWWMKALIEFNVVVATLTSLCGLMIAVVGVWRILSRKPPH